MYATPRELAISLIKPYVLRGDDPEWITSGYMGMAIDGYSVSIGGYCNGKFIGNDKIIVTEFENQETAIMFSFQELYDEIKSRQSQPTLF